MRLEKVVLAPAGKGGLVQPRWPGPHAYRPTFGLSASDVKPVGGEAACLSAMAA